MSSSYLKPEEIMEMTIENGIKKTGFSAKTSIILGFQAGAFIALGYLLSIRITAPLTGDIEGLGTILGASVFPIGLILTLIAGGELLTGNMMAVPLAGLAGRISIRAILQNWAIITLSNFLGAIFVAYAFGHIAGLTSSGIFLEKTVSIAGHKLEATFLQGFVSGIGCNWLVAAAVWLSYGAKDIIGKIAGIWFPTMAFVAIGFQHVVANMFVIPAAIFEGHYTWSQYIANFVPVFLGNATGGAVFIAMAYWLAYRRKGHTPKATANSSVILLKRKG
ncbi:formate/nitrite transporter family protein [Bacillus sp. FJAT-27445]|uniref:formate/nitrite transporter family protein n=1 Tax=Bacillus sp. FJAT-27445 TaxID=1679166 RepID=UPI000743F01A|nr:formate/nitrite transporter family protein [Bacillus sp. FJAT-27445]